jgi:hypothetical protein
MTAGPSHRGMLRPAVWVDAASYPDNDVLRAVVVVAGLCWSAAFIAVGLGYDLQIYGDGAIFSYAVAVQDAWAIHWHNISGRLFVYLTCFVPAEIVVEVTRSAHSGIVVYGLLLFAAPLAGLAATWAADRSKGRVIFVYACLSTACLAPLVFGFPTEVWIAHALFWPALAICHYARPGIGGFGVVLAALLALVFTHEGALILAGIIVATLLLRGARSAAFRRGAGALLIVVPIWIFVKVALPPDNYYAPVYASAALHFFDATIFGNELLLLLLATLAGYWIALTVLYRLTPGKAHLYATLIVTLALLVYWLWIDRALHANNRYYMRTALLIVTPALGVLAAAQALAAGDRPDRSGVPWLAQLTKACVDGVSARAICGAFLLVMLVHVVETTKFVTAWTDYKAAVRALAGGATSDPKLGDSRFVSSTRLSADLNRLSWNSTTPFLSVLLADGFAPARLVVDPAANYFWLSCDVATANLAADRAVPVDARRLVRIHACEHR